MIFFLIWQVSFFLFFLFNWCRIISLKTCQKMVSGSLWKLVWRDLLLWLVLYYIVMAVYRNNTLGATTRYICERFRNAIQLERLLPCVVHPDSLSFWLNCDWTRHRNNWGLDGTYSRCCQRPFFKTALTVSVTARLIFGFTECFNHRRFEQLEFNEIKKLVIFI